MIPKYICSKGEELRARDVILSIYFVHIIAYHSIAYHSLIKKAVVKEEIVL